MPAEVPKKFYRNVFRGVTYYTQRQKRPCKLSELVAYVYLQNNRALAVSRVEPLVKKALTELCSSGVIVMSRNRYQLNDLLVTPVAGPSDARSKAGTRMTSKTRRRSRPRPVDAEDAALAGTGTFEEENNATSGEENEQEELIIHRPFKLENDDDDSETTEENTSNAEEESNS